MATKVSLELQFLTDQNSKVRVTIPNPKLPIDSTAVNNAMDLMIGRNVFAFTQGKLVGKVGAVEIQTDSTTIA